MMAECWAPISGDGCALFLHARTDAAGWRITSWDRTGPVGHVVFDSLEEARANLTRDTGPRPAIPDLGIHAELATYEQVEHAPAWLGLAVITAGVVETP